MVVSTYPSEKWWSSSVGMKYYSQFIWKNNKCSKPPTSIEVLWFWNVFEVSESPKNYPLVNVNKKLWKITILNRYIHYFNGSFSRAITLANGAVFFRSPCQTVGISAGILTQRCLWEVVHCNWFEISFTSLVSDLCRFICSSRLGICSIEKHYLCVRGMYAYTYIYIYILSTVNIIHINTHINTCMHICT